MLHINETSKADFLELIFYFYIFRINQRQKLMITVTQNSLNILFTQEVLDLYHHLLKSVVL